MAHACERIAILFFFFFKQKTAYEIGLGIPAEPLFRSSCFRLLFLAIIQTFFLISWFSLLLLKFLRHWFYTNLNFFLQRFILIVLRLMLELLDFFIAFSWIHLFTPLIVFFMLGMLLLWLS